MCGVKTNIVTSVEISDAYANDYNFYKLVGDDGRKWLQDGRVSADKLSLAPNLLTTLRHGAIPYIPFKTNSKCRTVNLGAKSTLWDRSSISTICIAKNSLATTISDQM